MASTPLCPTVCPGHNKAIVELQYRFCKDENATYFISACLDKLAMIRDANTGDWVGTLVGHNGAIWSAKMSGDASIAATGAADFSIKIWDAVDGKEKATIPAKHIVKTVDFSPDDKFLATGGQDKLLRIFELARVEAGAVKEFAHPKGVRKALWRVSDGGKTIITGCEDGILRVWDVASGTVVKELVAASDSAPIMDLELSPQHLNTLTVAAGKEVLLVDATTFEIRKRFAYRYSVECASLRPTEGGGFFVAGGSDVHVHVCSSENGEELHTERGHHGAVHCARWHPEGNSFASGADDATIRLWKFDPASLKGSGSSPASASSATAATATA